MSADPCRPWPFDRYQPDQEAVQPDDLDRTCMISFFVPRELRPKNRQSWSRKRRLEEKFLRQKAAR